MSRPSAWLLIALCLGATTLLPPSAAPGAARPTATLLAVGDIASCDRRDRRAGRRPRRPHARHGRAARRPRVRQRHRSRVRPLLHARLGAHHAADPRVARESRVRERRKRRVGGAVDLRPLGGRVVLLRPRRLARRRAQLELRGGRGMQRRLAPVALAASRPPTPPRGTLHARLLAPPPVQLRAPRLRRAARRLLEPPRRGARRRRAERPRSRLRALRPDRGDPLVRRGNGRARAPPVRHDPPEERRRARPSRSECSGSPCARAATAGAS